MIRGLLGKKIEMSQVFDDETMEAVPVTLLEVGPCVVTQIKEEETDGYNAVQLGFGRKNRLSRPQAGHLEKSGVQPRFVNEIRVHDSAELDGLEVSQRISLDDVFQVGGAVTVTGTSKGKGFTGVVKRWGFHGGPKTHGQSDRHRAPGSIGTQGAKKVLKGKKMAGRKGGQQTTIKGLEVISIDAEKNLMQVKGSVPGNRSGLLTVTKTD